MAKVAIFGSSGMLGSALVVYLKQSGHEITEVNRRGVSFFPSSPVIKFKVDSETEVRSLAEFKSFDLVINAMGIVSQLIIGKETHMADNCNLVNSIFPSVLNEFSKQSSVNVLQIGTDCVFNAKKGNFNENAKYEPTDLYSASKIKGEIVSSETQILRTSIVGREIHSNKSLMEWILSQPSGANVKGYNNHFWNGMTTLHFAKLTDGIIKHGNFQKGIQHVIPNNVVSKFELVSAIASAFHREDIEISSFTSPNPTNRSLDTVFPDENRKLWLDAGYQTIPNVQEMIVEYAAWDEKYMRPLREVAQFKAEN
jgi:dTDP-4-dehydrorhamnose reductase